MSRAKGVYRPCPVCGQTVAVAWQTEKLWLHGPETNRCPGSGVKVDLWGRP